MIKWTLPFEFECYLFAIAQSYHGGIQMHFDVQCNIFSPLFKNSTQHMTMSWHF